MLVTLDDGPCVKLSVLPFEDSFDQHVFTFSETKKAGAHFRMPAFFFK
jgi:hypothetical protein